MSANDTPAVRMLFAILQQKDLRDVNWLDVALNPLMGEPQAPLNEEDKKKKAHATRMRYARLKKQLESLKPQLETPPPEDKGVETGRITKRRYNRKNAAGSTTSKTRNSGADVSFSSVSSPAKAKEGGKFPVAQDEQPRFDLATQADLSDNLNMQARLKMRLLTPCSDSDVMASSQAYATSPASEMVHSDASSFNFASPTHHGTAAHNASHWAHGGTYDNFGNGYALGSFSPAAYGGHQQLDLQSTDDLGNLLGMDNEGDVPVKHEWEGPYHHQPC
ncbi:hypothetical protein B0H63DRAFT_146099 [Podospora didyma]|uniref:Uncharacterized protein n=1 Tax=Podospora didyma TaxID=330526 RepID=A0AAE0U1D8_9PEZI|nr:hypothetical protein B0H63DRAFT_146099 [Podospora didyma]